MQRLTENPCYQYVAEHIGRMLVDFNASGRMQHDEPKCLIIAQYNSLGDTSGHHSTEKPCATPMASPRH